MSASLASARMNSGSPRSAWIAASLRSSDFFISATSTCLALALPEMVTRDPDAPGLPFPPAPMVTRTGRGRRRFPSRDRA